MNIQSSTNTLNLALNAFNQNSNLQNQNAQNTNEKSLEEIVNESAVKVSISMNSQYILFAMD